MIKYLLVPVIFISSVNHAVALRDEIRVVGSPEVLLYVQRVAQNFTLVSEFAAPSLEVTGTGNGFKLFCDGNGFEYPDINAASRRITDSEFAVCQTNGVAFITEIAIGLDGIVLANSKATNMNSPVNMPLVPMATWQKRGLFPLMTRDAIPPAILP